MIDLDTILETEPSFDGFSPLLGQEDYPEVFPEVDLEGFLRFWMNPFLRTDQSDIGNFGIALETKSRRGYYSRIFDDAFIDGKTAFHLDYEDDGEVHLLATMSFDGNSDHVDVVQIQRWKFWEAYLRKNPLQSIRYSFALAVLAYDWAIKNGIEETRIISKDQITAYPTVQENSFFYRPYDFTALLLGFKAWNGQEYIPLDYSSNLKLAGEVERYVMSKDELELRGPHPELLELGVVFPHTFEFEFIEKAISEWAPKRPKKNVVVEENQILPLYGPYD